MFILNPLKWTGPRYKFAANQAIITQAARHMGQMQTPCSNPYKYVRNMAGAVRMFGLYIPSRPTEAQYECMLRCYRGVGKLADQCKKIAMYHQDAPSFWYDLKKIRLDGDWDDGTEESLRSWIAYNSETYGLAAENFPSPDHLDNYFEQRFDIDKLISGMKWHGIVQCRFYAKGYYNRIFEYGPPERRFFLFGTKPSDAQKSPGIVTCSIDDHITIKTQMEKFTTMLCYTHRP